MYQIFLRTFVVIFALVLAHAAPGTCADTARHPAQTRPISDFLEKQGQHLTKGIVPEFIAFTAYFNPDDGTNRAVSIDYAGLGARVIRQKTHGVVSLHTKMDGVVYERPLPDGRAEVTVQLHTRNALSFVISQPDADFDAQGQAIFGYRPQDIVEDFQADGHLDVTPSVGSCFFHIVLINTEVGAVLPDLAVFVGIAPTLPGQELVSITMFADANGTIRNNDDSQPGSLQVRQASGVGFSFPIEEIILQVITDRHDGIASADDPDEGGQ